jgi:DNA-binding MarR family transcriptional regulator
MSILSCRQTICQYLHVKSLEKNPTVEHRTLGALLQAPYQVLLKEVYGALAAAGYPDIRQAHSSVFRNILPSGSGVSYMAEKAGMTKQSMAYLVESLRDGGYVEVVPDPDDRRAKIVRVTERGRTVQGLLMANSRRAEKEWASLIGAEEMETLRSLLERLHEALDTAAG